LTFSLTPDIFEYAPFRGVSCSKRTLFFGKSCFCRPRGKIKAHASRDRDELVVADLDLGMTMKVRNMWQFFRDRRPETCARIVEE
jgi:N-carbamoylputrescine amidase